MPRPNINYNLTRPNRAQVAELLFLKEQERLLVRERALQDYWFFVTNVLWKEESKKHFYEPLHKPIADRITAAKPGCRDLLIMTRRGRKSFLRTIGHCVWRITRDPNVRIIVVSALDSTAKEFMAGIKRQFQLNKEYAYYFPEMAVPEGKLGTEEVFTHPARTNIHVLNPTIFATYLGAPLLGKRGDIIILDDPIAEKHVTTVEQVDKTMGWINDIFPLLDESEEYNGMLFVNGTLKSFMDPYAAMLGKDRGSDLEVGITQSRFISVVIPALVDKSGEPDIKGEPIFPTVLDKATLMGYLQDAELDPNRGQGHFYREYLCQCQSPSEQKFLPEWFNSWTPVLPPVAFSALAVDTAVKDKAAVGRGDFSVILCGHMDVHGHLYFTDGARSDSWRAADLMRELVGMAQRNGGVYTVLRERVGEALFFPMCEEAFHRQRLPCTTYPLSVAQEGRKVVRIMEALQGPAQGRRIHFVGDPVAGTGFPKALHKVLSDELCFLSMWAHDDAADAASLFFHRDVRIIPSAHRSTKWTPFTRARLQQPSTPRFNLGATRTPPRGGGDGTLRGEDPFVSQVLDNMGRQGGNVAPRPQSPFGYKVPVIRGLEDL